MSAVSSKHLQSEYNSPHSPLSTPLANLVYRSNKESSTKPSLSNSTLHKKRMSYSSIKPATVEWTIKCRCDQDSSCPPDASKSLRSGRSHSLSLQRSTMLCWGCRTRLWCILCTAYVQYFQLEHCFTVWWYKWKFHGGVAPYRSQIMTIVQLVNYSIFYCAFIVYL